MLGGIALANAYIAQGINPGAGFVQGAMYRNEMAMKDRDFQATQNYRNQVLQSQNQRQASADQIAFGKETLSILSSLPEEQRPAAYLARAELAARTIGLPEGFDPAQGWEKTKAQLPPYVAGQGPLPSAAIQNYNYRTGLPEGERATFDAYVRSMPVKDVAGVPSQITPGGVVPLSTIEQETEAAEAMSAATASGTASGKESAAMTVRDRKKTETGQALQSVFDELNPKDVRGRYGFVGGAAGAWGQGQKNVELLINRLTKILAVNEREKLRGQGTITDNETKMLEDALSILTDFQAGDDLAIGELERIAGMFGIQWNSKGKSANVGRFTVEEVDADL